MVKNFESDVLVVGTGGAGLRAAIEAYELGTSVVVVSKAPVGMNNATVVSGGGFRAAIEGLTPEEHMEDTIRVGNGLNDRRLVEVFAREGGERVLELRRFGVEIRIHRGGISVGEIPGLMGQGMTKPMVDYLRGKDVGIVENVVLTRLLVSEGAVVGAVGYDAHNDHPVVFSAGAVVLATGGAGALYRRTDCPLRTTGDGYSLAYHAGAALRDMEFVQFFPVALAEPGHPPFLMGGVITEEGRIVNRLGEDIPEKHGVKERPLVLKSRGPLSVAIMREVLAGNGVNGAVLLDATGVFKKYGGEEGLLTGQQAYLRDRLMAAERPLRIAPICHFCMGGVVADVDGYMGVQGLFAAGEVVGGVHGANRHGGNALTDITVFGARAGASAAEYAKKSPRGFSESLAKPELDHYHAIRTGKAGEAPSPTGVMSALREFMWEKAGIVRTGDALKGALAGIAELRGEATKLSASSGREMLFALEVPMALDAAEMIARAALERTESRGAHFREDHPEEDDGWLKTVVLRKAPDRTMSLSTRPL
jgi:succinate dehydrogenase/fumarate reductase flavoprotein subunit